MFDPLTKTQLERMGRIAQSILNAIDLDGPSIEDRSPNAVSHINGEWVSAGHA